MGQTRELLQLDRGQGYRLLPGVSAFIIQVAA